MPLTQPTPRRLWLRRLLITSAMLLLLLVVATITTAINLRHDLRTSLPQLDGNLPVAGLTAPVTVTRDPHGVPSIHASNLDDLLFAQGYITASDRLFQMDALRRHGAGELAELLGSSLIPHDRQQRYLQLRATADRAAALLPPDQLHQLQAYANGVNAFISSATSPKNRSPSAQVLPVEFHLLHYNPRPWLPRDSLLISLVMAQDLSTRFPSKLNREALAAHLPIALLPDLYPIGSWRDHPPTQPSTDLTTPTDTINQIPLDKTQSRNTPPPCRHKAGCPTSGFSDVGLQASTATTTDLIAVSNALRTALCDGCRSGSNNWAVAGSHTATGAPLLSNDMHLGLTAPDIWYEASLHVDTPTDPTPAVRARLNVTGFTLPGVPFVVAGRNQFVAWGFTNSGADVQDVVIEHLRNSGKNHGPQTEFQHPDGTWSLAQHQTEVIHVRAGRDLTLDVLLTSHSIGDKSIPTPIISPLYPTERRALALEWTIYDASTITSPLYKLNTATDAASLVAAAVDFASVSENLVYADAHHIGFHLLGRIPIRGPAIQHPRPAAPFILPDNTPPEEDNDDESGSLIYPATNPGAPHLASEMGVSSHKLHPPGAPYLDSEMWDPNRQLHPNPTHFIPATSMGAAHNQVPQGFSLGSHRPIKKGVQVSQNASPAYARAAHNQVPQGFSLGSHRPIKKGVQVSQGVSPGIPAPDLPSAPTTPYTIGNPISPVPIDALDQSQTWSGYIPYDQLPSVIDPTSGIIATANARITPDIYPYFITNEWTDPYRVERIYTLLQNRSGLTPADMLTIQTDTHSDLDLLAAQRFAYALDHASAHADFTQKDVRLRQAADLLRSFDGNMSPDSPAAAIVAATRAQLWSMLLAPQLRPARFRDSNPDSDTPRTPKLSSLDIAELLDLYTWDEKTTALEQILLHTPARWLPRAYATWDDLLAGAVQLALKNSGAPADLNTWSYGKIHEVEIPHPLFGSNGIVALLLNTPTGTGLHPIGGDGTTIKQTGLHFGPSERFTANLSNPEATRANITTGESGSPASPWFLDQFPLWLQGTTLPLPLTHPTITHTLTLTPQ
jgi:acyl-homoserine lactone acylase PvdQ